MSISRETLVKMPKIDLHRHVEGAFDLPTLFKLSQKNQLDFPADYSEFVKKLQFPRDAKPDFALFLSKFFNGWYANQDDVYAVAYNSILNIDRQENLFYTELRFNPLHYSIKRNFDRLETLNTFLAAAKAAIKEKNMNARLLITFNRGFQTEDEMISLFQLFLDKADMDLIAGIDLAGDEVTYPPEQFANFFDFVHKQGFMATIHAGEVTGPEQVRYAIENMHAARIGHGVGIIKDEQLQDEAAARGTAFEMCMISNYQTGAWPDYKTHPIKYLLKKGLCITLNSDDPTVQDSTLNDDYDKAANQLGLKIEDFKQLNINAIDAAFINGEEKASMKKKYLEEFAKSLV